MNAQIYRVIAILKKHSQLENTAKTRFQDFKIMKFATPHLLAVA
jgi:hypothetical protein